MPGTERSLGPFDARVERSLIGDRLVKGRLRDHLVLPLRGLNVHIRAVQGGADFDMCSAGGVPGVCTWRGVHGGVYRVPCPCSCFSFLFPLFPAVSDFSDFSDVSDFSGFLTSLYSCISEAVGRRPEAGSVDGLGLRPTAYGLTALLTGYACLSGRKGNRKALWT